MALDPRTPVIVGAGQLTHRTADGPVPTPLQIMAGATRAAAQDAGPSGLKLLERAEVVACVDLFSWPVPDPARALSLELGLQPRATWRTPVGGNSPITLLGALAQEIADGALDVAVLAGGEAGTTFQKAARTGADPGFGTQPEGTAPTRLLGEDRDPADPSEQAAGLIAPIFVYPLFEQAVRAAAGRGPVEHLAHLGELWLRFADVARDNPHAWTPDPPRTAAELTSAGAGNRLVSDPYPKAMNANIAVDQGAALIVCSARAAADAGIDPAQCVRVEATATAHDHWFVSARDRLDRSPAIAATTSTALGHAGVGIDDVAMLDLYSCFPSAVQIAGTELGIDLLDPSRAPTVTGGLPFAGGPANNYVTHALATLVTELREQPEQRGLATAVGWYLTKHGAAVLAGPDAAPAPRPFAQQSVQDAVDALPFREIVPVGETVTGPVETYTAIYDRDGSATMGIVAVRDGERRALARTHERGVISALLLGDPLGRRATIAADGTFTL